MSATLVPVQSANFARGPAQRTIGPSNHLGRAEIAMLTEMPAKLLAIFVVLITACDMAFGQIVPLPRPRPVTNVPSPQSAAPVEAEPPSDCRRRLTDDLALAPSIHAIEGPGGCGAGDLVRLEAIVLASKSRVAVTPPAILRCTLAEAIVQWVRNDIAPAARALHGTLKSIDNYSSYDCRGRNRIAGAQLSEHGKANALDVRSIRLGSGAVIELTDPHVPKDFRDNLRARTCARFSTVLGPGSDGYHENHIHVDLALRASGYRICHWDVREPEQESTQDGSAGAVPLPRPRPGRG
jgi:hypothetical protein